MKIYIAGKITGLMYEEALALFDRAEKELKGRFPGHEIVNPMRHEQIPKDASWEEQMRCCFTVIPTCQRMFMLMNWRESRGALAEHQLAIRLGLEIIYEEAVDL